MATYKLHYFNSRGVAETIRFIFAQAGVQYEDIRHTQEEWVKVKPDSPWGTMPFLEVDGKTIGGSTVIARYLGEKFGMAGSDEIENAQVAAAVDAVGDLQKDLLKFAFEKDMEKQASLKKELEESKLPDKLKFFEKLSAKSGAPEGWLFGKLTYADFSLSLTLGFFVTHADCGAVVERFPGVSALKQAVENLPRIKEWIEKRPKTDH